jgi:hypothetical protein
MLEYKNDKKESGYGYRQPHPTLLLATSETVQILRNWTAHFDACRHYHSLNFSATFCS